AGTGCRVWRVRPARLEAVQGADEPLVHVDDQLAAEQQLALFLDEHGVPLVLAHFQFMPFRARLGKQPDRFLYRFSVHLDLCAAQKLIEVELKLMLLRLADSERESHTRSVCTRHARLTLRPKKRTSASSVEPRPGRLRSHLRENEGLRASGT